MPTVAAHLDAKTREQIQSDLDVGLADEFAHHTDRHVSLLRRQRQSHQQGGQELTGNIASHRNHFGQFELRLTNAQRWKTVLAQVVDLTTELAQSIDQIADRPLMHARHALQREVATHHGQGGGQRTHRGTGVAHEKRNRFAWFLLLAKPMAQASDA